MTQQKIEYSTLNRSNRDGDKNSPIPWNIENTSSNPIGYNAEEQSVDDG